MRPGPRLVGLLLAFACGLYLTAGSEGLCAAPAPGGSVKIGVLAKRGAQQCMAKWGPTAEYLNRRLPEYSFLIVPLGFQQIQDAVDQNRVDFILANSSFYVELEVAHGVQRVATLENLHAGGSSHRVFAGVLFCRADREDIRTLDDMRGQTFMAVDAESFGGWRMQWREMLEQGLDPYSDLASLEFAGSHDAVVFAVLSGRAAVGAVRSDTLERMAQEGLVDLADFKVLNAHLDPPGVHMPFLHSTRHYPEWPMARTAATPDRLAKEVTTALLQMQPEDEAARAAHCTGWSPPENYQAVHDCLLELRCPPYQDYGRVSFFAAVRKVWPWLTMLLVLGVVVLLIVIRSSRLKARLQQSQELAAERSRGWDFVRQVLDRLPVGVLLIDVEKRSVVEVNPMAAVMMGRASEDIVGRSCHDFICPHLDGDCPILDRGQTVDHSERILLADDGREVPVLKTVVPMEVQGRRYLLEAMLDISAHKAAEAERERLTHAIEQVGEMIVITDAEGVIRYVNPSFTTITGYSRQEALGNKMSLVKSGRHEKGFYERLWQTISRGDTWTGQITNRRKDGTLFTEAATISPVRDERARIVNFVGVKRDITEQLALENRYQHSQKMETIGRLAGGVAHDYNNMIGVILGYADMILNREQLEPGLRDEVLQIQGAAKRSADLTRQLLGFARKQSINPEVLDSNLTVENMLKMLRRLMGEKVGVEWRPCAEPWAVKMDPTQVDQILVNLCVNSRDAMPQGGRITIATTNVSSPALLGGQAAEVAAGQYLQLTISDEGCGMDPEVLDKAFEPFFTTKDQGKGTGLGLATVYGIVQQNGGFVDILSEVGKGTAISIYLPRHEREEIPEPGEAPAPLAVNGATVLLVEDEVALLQVVARILEDQGYTVLMAETPTRALALAHQHAAQLNLLITDVIMPDMDGDQLAGAVREFLPDLPCLFMSGYLPSELQHLSSPGQGFHFIQKPFQFPSFLQKVQEVLNDKLRV